MFAIAAFMDDTFSLIHNLGSFPCIPHAAFQSDHLFILQSHLVEEASKVITNPQVLINVISRRVRQLTSGHRPLVESKPGTGFADIALMEVIQKKTSFEATLGFKAEPVPERTSYSKGFGTNFRAA